MIICCLILSSVIFSYFTLPKIRAFLNKRDVFINEHLSKQDELIKKAEGLIQEYEMKIIKAKEEANSIINNAKSQAIEESEKLLKITEDKIKQQIKETEEKINKEKKNALNELEKEISVSANLFISKITNQPLENIKIS